ncbi:MAG: ABC transporter substrate-binding protein, partial [Cellulomonas sp.]
MARRPVTQRVALAAAVAVGFAALVGCTGDPAPLPSRTGGVVVAVDVPFASLNAATPRGRTPGSVLVRSLVQDGFVSLDAGGRAVPDEGFGTVEKLADDPLTVRYTLARTATWSDGVPVTAADLLLEWAARSGSLDDVVPELGDDGEVVNGDALDSGVAFAATSRALVHAQSIPTVDDEGRVTVVYARPVPDWQVALDVNLPAHVLGREALGVEDDVQAAQAVVAALAAPADHHDDLSALSRAWRTAYDDDALAAAAGVAVTTGPYAVSKVLPDQRVELVRNEQYTGSRPARFDSLVVRSDVHPLDQVTALRDGEVDVVAPVATADVREALDDAGARVVAGGDAVWQLVAQVA